MLPLFFRLLIGQRLADARQHTVGTYEIVNVYVVEGMYVVFAEIIEILGDTLLARGFFCLGLSAGVRVEAGYAPVCTERGGDYVNPLQGFAVSHPTLSVITRGIKIKRHRKLKHAGINAVRGKRLCRFIC